jgi:hypothetical protein
MRVSRVFCYFQRPSLFALLALLLTATHCVDIDDRDLEVTEGDGDDDGTGGSRGGTGGSQGGGSQGGSSGTSGDACAPDGDDNDCSLCTKENCCNELTTCGESVQCAEFFYCWEPCLDDLCVEDCIAMHPVGAEQLGAFLGCTNDYCYDVCS